MKTSISILVAALVVAMLLPVSAFKGAANGLLTFSAIIAAIILPTMAITVSALRPTQKSPKILEEFRQVLNKQFSFWVSFLALVIFLAGALILGQALDWKGGEFQQKLPYFGQTTLRPVGLLNVAIVTCLLLIAVRAKPFVDGFRSLLNLHIDQVIEESRMRFDDATTPVLREIESQAGDPDFGRTIERPH